MVEQQKIPDSPRSNAGGSPKRSAANLALNMILVLIVFFISPVAADQGWMFRADEVHSGVFENSGILPVGEIRWSTYTNGAVTSSPAVVDGVVYVGSNDNQVYTFNTADGTKIWSTYTNGAVTSSPAVVDGVVYFGSSDSQVYAFNTADGTKIWSTYTSEAVSSSPAVVDGVVYVGSNDFQVYAFNTANGTKIWSTYTNGAVTSSPAVVDGVVYVGSSDSQVYAFDAVDGIKIWSAYTNGAVTSSPAVVDGVVYIGSSDYQVYAFNATDGSKLWSAYTNGAVTSSPAVVDGVVYVGSSDSQVYAFNATDGSKLWSTYTNGAVTSSPAVVDGVVYVGSSDSQVYAFNATDGSKLWSAYTNGAVTSSPAVVNGVVYVGSSDSQVYAFGKKVPIPAFTGTPTNGPSPLTVSFTDASTETITGWNWDFGDGTFSTERNPVHIYPGPGKYTINLTVTGPGGTVSLVKPDYIQVTFDFSGTPRSGQPPLTVTFSDTLPADTTSRYWDFGDGNTGTGKDPVHTYAIQGSFTVTLNATGPDWESTLKKEHYINTYAVPNNIIRWIISAGTTRNSNSPPLISEGFAYLEGGKTLYAVNISPGTDHTWEPFWDPFEWKITANDVFSISEVFDKTVYCKAGNTVYALDASSGTEKWHFTAPDSVGRPARYDSLICFNSGKTIYGIDLYTRKEKWKFTATENFTEVKIGQGIISGDLYAGAGKTLYAIDTSTGKERWERKFEDPIGNFPILITNNKVIISTFRDLPDVNNWIWRNWTFSAVNTLDGAESWKTKEYFEQEWAQEYIRDPVIVDGFIIIVSRAGISANDLNTGREKWLIQPNAHYEQYWIISSNDKIFLWYWVFISQPGSVSKYHWLLREIDVKTGNIKQTMDLNSDIAPTSVAVDHDRIYIGFPYRLIAIDWNEGTIAWELKMSGDDVSTPVISHGVLFVNAVEKPSLNHRFFYAIGNPISFSGTPRSGPIPLTVAFSDTSTNETTNWWWDFGDGTTSNDRNPVHTYWEIGEYSVKLKATDAVGFVSRSEKGFIHAYSNLTVMNATPDMGMRGTTIPITIHGYNFTPDMSVSLARGYSVIPATGIVVDDSTRIICNVALPINAQPGPYDIRVTRTTYPDSQSLIKGFFVLCYPPPVVTALDPTITFPGTLQRFNLTGSNFLPNSTVAFTNPAGSKFITTSITNSESEIFLTATFPADGVGPWSVVVTNPDGGWGTLPNALEVMPSNADTPAPSVSSVTPEKGIAGMTLSMKISGADFSKGSSVKLIRGSNEIPASRIVLMGATEMRATVRISSSAVPGQYDLVVINNKGQAGMLRGAVMIGGGNSPVLTTLTPTTMNTGATTSFTLTGNRFQDGATVVFENATFGTLTPDNVGITTRKITGTLSIPEGAATGTWSVTVINPDGESASLPDALTVRTQSSDDGTGPKVTSVKPSSGSAGKIVGLIIKGEDFTKGSTVKLTYQSTEILASRVLTLNPTKMFIIVTIPPETTPGMYDLVVTDKMGRSGTLIGGFTIMVGSSSS